MARRVFAVLMLLVVPAMLIYLYRHQPGDKGYLPQCSFHQLTGLNCIGCGGTRAMHFLLHGQLKAAFWYNPIAILLGPYIAYAMTTWSIATLRGQPPRNAATLWPAKWVWTGVVFLIAFWIGRNLPWYPLGP